MRISSFAAFVPVAVLFALGALLAWYGDHLVRLGGLLSILGSVGWFGFLFMLLVYREES